MCDVNKSDELSSDADTDDMILSGVEFMSSAASINNKQRKPQGTKSPFSHNISQDQRSEIIDPLTPESQQLPSGASASFYSRFTRNSTARRSLNFDKENTIEDNKKSGHSAPNTPKQSCIKTVQSPFRPSHMSVCFNDKPQVRKIMENKENMQSLSSGKSPHSVTQPIVSQFGGEINEIFCHARDEFGRLSRMSDLSNEQQQNVSFALDDKDMAEEAFINGVGTKELRQLLEAETVKRRHCERKITLVQKHALKLEQRLTLSETIGQNQNRALQEVEQVVVVLVEDFVLREKERIELCETLVTENLNFKENLALARSYGQTAAKRNEELEIKIKHLEETLATERNNTQTLRFQNDSLSMKIDQMNKEHGDLAVCVEKLRSVKEENQLKEKEMTKEILELESLLKQSTQDVQRLKIDLNSERNSRKLQLEEKEREIRMKLNEQSTRFDRKIEEARKAVEQQNSAEVQSMKSEFDSILTNLNNRLERTKAERDEAQNKLNNLEKNLETKQQQMCAELQQKLAGKYQELLSEFGAAPHQQQPSYGGQYAYNSVYGYVVPGVNSGDGVAMTTSNVQQSVMGNESPNLADEFMKQLQNVNTIGTPRHEPLVGVSSNFGAISGPSIDPNQTKKAQLQSYLKQFISKPGGHPSDPAK